jgi:hypothetical protein
MGGQRELRWHEPEWHVERVWPVLEPTHAHGGKPDADTNGHAKSDAYVHSNTYANSYSNSNSNPNSYGYGYSYSYFNTNSYGYSYRNADSDG